MAREKRKLRGLFGAAVAGALVFPGAVLAQRVDRLSSEFSPPGVEIFTSSSTPFEFYRVTVRPKGDNNVLFVTISATGDGHDGAATVIGCSVDGVPCKPQQNIVLQRHFTEDVLQDNAIYYTWCLPVEKGDRVVSLQLSSDFDGGKVAIEDVHVIVDTVKSRKLCREGTFTFGNEID